MKKIRILALLMMICLLIPSFAVMGAEKQPFAEIAQPETGIIGGMTFTQRIETKSDLDNIIAAQIKPACVIFNVTKDGNVSDFGRANAFATFEEAVSALDGKIMPGFYVTTEDEAIALKSYLRDSGLEDVFVISSSPELVLSVRKTIKISRGIIDFTDAYKDKEAITEEELLKIRGIANSNNASIVILPSNIANRDSVKYITDRLVTVWINEISPLTSASKAFELITSGPHGIISDNTELLVNTANEYLSEKALIRTPLNIGHRGIPSQAPENTVEGSLKAYENGADVIEIDIYLTTDNEIVIMHDATTGRTCNKDLSVEKSSLAQLQELYVNKGFEKHEEFKEVRIPTLQDYYKAFKDKDAMIFVEIKSQKKEIITRLKEITEEYEMEDQISIITFHTNQLTNMRKLFPTMSIGYLQGNITESQKTTEDKVKKVLNTIQKFGSTYNPSYGGHTEDYIIAANMRGVTTWPWTINNLTDYNNFFLQGYNGLTTNNVNFIKNYAKFVDCPAYQYTLKPGEKHTVSATMTEYDRDTKELFAEKHTRSRIIVLEGGENAEINGTEITFKSDSCTFTYAVEYTYMITRTNTYSVYSQPVTVTVKSDTVPETPATESVETNEPVSSDGNSSAGMIIGIVAAAVAISLVAVIIVIKKKKN